VGRRGCRINAADRARLDQVCELFHALSELRAPASRHLTARLDELHCDSMAAAEDRILRVAGAVLVEHDRGDLFEEIFAVAREGSNVQPGDARRFLFSGGAA
jgi:hypothetical protein